MGIKGSLSPQTTRFLCSPSSLEDTSGNISQKPYTLTVLLARKSDIDRNSALETHTEGLLWWFESWQVARGSAPESSPPQVCWFWKGGEALFAKLLALAGHKPPSLPPSSHDW